MKKINLRGISEILSEKELKNVMGGSGGSGSLWCGWSSGPVPCLTFWEGRCDSCSSFYSTHCAQNATKSWCG